MGVVAPTIDIFRLIHVESLYLLILRANPPSGRWWTQIKMGSEMKVMGLPKALSHLIFWDV